MKRLVAALTLFATLLGAVAPSAALHRHARKACCCKAAPTDALCALDCCGIEKARPLPTTVAHVPTLTFALKPGSLVAPVVGEYREVAPPPQHALVELHERLATRLPLRI